MPDHSLSIVFMLPFEKKHISLYRRRVSVSIEKKQENASENAYCFVNANSFAALRII